MLSEFVQAVNLGALSRLCRSRLVPLPADHPEGPVDWVSGAAVMMRLPVIAALGGFDPDFFLYYEEVELMHRIRRAGHRIDYVPAARVIHAEGAATDVRSSRPDRVARPAYWYDSWRLYHLKTRGRAGALAAGLGWYQYQSSWVRETILVHTRGGAWRPPQPQTKIQLLVHDALI